MKMVLPTVRYFYRSSTVITEKCFFPVLCSKPFILLMIFSKADTLMYFAACKQISKRHAREKNGKRAVSTTPHGAFI